MKTLVLLGLQWGDEGKGKIIDHLAAEHDVTVRFQGGGNAGHTVVVGDQKHILHHIPSGILHEGKLNLIADGAVLDIETLFREIESLEKAGIDVKGRLYIGWGTHLVLPVHKALDSAQESGRGETKIGTTGRGIGPCYADRRARIGIRFRDLYDPGTLPSRIERLLGEKNCLFEHLYAAPVVEADVLLTLLRGWADRLAGFGVSTPGFIGRALKDGRSVLFEGAQGTLLDADWGTYPFVTSSTTTVGAVSTGCGLAPGKIGTILGVVKAYTTRVGAGPFPTEDSGAVGEHLRDRGGEFGSTTGRPRRCGWLDAVAGRFAVELNGVDGLVITKLDVLSGLDEIRVCTSYGTEEEFSADPAHLAKARPVYRTFTGWQEDIASARSMADLPDACRTYLDGIEALLGVPVRLISVGPERRQVFQK
jgi:adenylosuccinate synthase